jgi:hypothetical protein
VAKEAETTVVIFRNARRVAVNWALRKGELIEDRSNEISNALTALLRKKKQRGSAALGGRRPFVFRIPAVCGEHHFDAGIIIG